MDQLRHPEPDQEGGDDKRPRGGRSPQRLADGGQRGSIESIPSAVNAISAAINRTNSTKPIGAPGGSAVTGVTGSAERDSDMIAVT